MKFQLPFVILAALALIVPGCSKKPAVPVQPIVDLGVVDLNNGTQNKLDLKNGTTCLVTPKSVQGGQIMLEMQIEKDGAVVASPRVEATPDQPVSVSLNDVTLKFTPHLK
jgi:uncharacterized lipoprotein YbaY